jgi:hypothetical protein
MKDMAAMTAARNIHSPLIAIPHGTDALKQIRKLHPDSYHQITFQVRFAILQTARSLIVCPRGQTAEPIAICFSCLD